jgi:DNA-binding LacI/PurR family transcriptional regulator
VEDTIAFGDHLAALYRKYDADGLVLLAYFDIDLAIYHAMMQGVVVLTDIASPRLDFLPTVQTDDVRHCQYAAEYLFKAGKSKILVADFMEAGNPRHSAFLAKMMALNPSAEIKYCSLRQPSSQFELYSTFKAFDEVTGVFSEDAFSNASLAGQFVQHQVPIRDSFIVYDCDDDVFRFPGLPPIPTCAPSFRALGEHLASKLIDRIEQGFWQEPLRELM